MQENVHQLRVNRQGRQHNRIHQHPGRVRKHSACHKSILSTIGCWALHASRNSTATPGLSSMDCSRLLSIASMGPPSIFPPVKVWQVPRCAPQLPTCASQLPGNFAACVFHFLISGQRGEHFNFRTAGHRPGDNHREAIVHVFKKCLASR